MTEDREDRLQPGGGAEPTVGASGLRRLDPGSDPAPVFGRGALVALLVWGFAVLAVTAGIAGGTVLWPILPVFGAAIPVLLAVLNSRTRAGALRQQQMRELFASDDRAERAILRCLEQTETCVVLLISGRRLGFDKKAGYVAKMRE
jgi:hypothetical protein